MQDTQVVGVVLCLKYFLNLDMGEKKLSYHTREELWVKIWQWKVWKNKFPLAMQLLKFHFSLFLFSSQTRQFLKYMDPIEKSFRVRVGVELMSGKVPVQEPARMTVIKIIQFLSKSVHSQIISVHLVD